MAGAEADFAAWLARTPSAAKGFEAGRRLAAYINGSCMVEPRGLYRRPAMLMNTCHMHSVWSWDHCFNAMALVYHDPALAWDQLMLLADHQDECGVMPDSISDLLARWNHGKPPVHGWALRFMMQRAPRSFTRPRLEVAYAWLAAWSNWWLTHRLWAGDVLPYYVHGNDSGWDNSTIFDQGVPVVAPDLAAHLALQLDVLAARIARNYCRGAARCCFRENFDALTGEGCSDYSYTWTASVFLILAHEFVPLR